VKASRLQHLFAVWRSLHGARSKLIWLADRIVRKLRLGVIKLPIALTLRTNFGILPFAVRIGETDILVLEEVFIKNEYALILEHVPSDIRTIVDVGANIGASVLLWSRAFPRARIVAVEPDSENINLCRKTAELGGANADFVEAFVGGTPRRSAIDRGNGARAYRLAPHSDSTAEGIPVVTLGELIASSGIGRLVDLIKLDCEGAEAEIMPRCASWIKSVRWLAIELHDEYTLSRLEEDLRRQELHEWAVVASVSKGSTTLALLRFN
jgi:FkbM family methyltransferase